MKMSGLEGPHVHRARGFFSLGRKTSNRFLIDQQR